MLLLALVILGVSGPLSSQDAGAPPASAPEIYVRPEVAPYEPPSSFGRRDAEGDAEPIARGRRRLARPVGVEAYRDNYEGRPSAREIGYEAAVARLGHDADALMGPLDGSWRVTGSDGKTVMDLVLSDRGENRAVEGGWSRTTSHAVVRIGVVASVTRDGDAVVIDMADAGSRADERDRGLELRLRQTVAGWSGVLGGEGRDRPVVMTRPG